MNNKNFKANKEAMDQFEARYKEVREAAAKKGYPIKGKGYEDDFHDRVRDAYSRWLLKQLMQNLWTNARNRGPHRGPR